MKKLTDFFNKRKITCEEELNILDIEDNIFFSLDNTISIYLKVEAIPFEYLDIKQKQEIVKRFIMELAGEKEIIKIIVMSLPVSLEVNKYLNDKRHLTKNSFKRNMISKQIEEIKELRDKGEMLEKKIFIQIFKNNNDNYAIEELNKRANELSLKLKNVGFNNTIMNRYEILQFFNSFLNLRFNNENINNIWSDESE